MKKLLNLLLRRKAVRFYTIPAPLRVRLDGSKFRPNSWDTRYHVANVHINGQAYHATYHLDDATGRWETHKVYFYDPENHDLYSHLPLSRIPRIHDRNLVAAEAEFNEWIVHLRRRNDSID